jgi:nicotinamide riboside kinase
MLSKYPIVLQVRMDLNYSADGSRHPEKEEFYRFHDDIMRRLKNQNYLAKMATNDF